MYLCYSFFDIPMSILPVIKSSAEVYGYIVSYYICNLMVVAMGLCKAYILCRLLRIIISLQLVLVPGHDNNVVDNELVS